MELQLTNVINVSVAATPSGLSAFNTSNLGLFTTETPDPVFDDGYKIYKEPLEVATDFGSSSITAAMALAVFSQQPNILAGDGYLVIMPFEPSETLDEAVTRTADLVQYFGVMSTQIESQADELAAAAVIQPLTKVGFFVQRTEAEGVDPDGANDKLRTGNLSKSRGLYYGADNDEDALVMMASYAGRGLSVDFSGSRTTMTMQLKDLIGVQPDPSMTQTIYNKAETAGVDIYASIQGVPKVISNGANDFYDQVYNLGWFVAALQIAGFNALAQTSTKIPQTEEGVDALKGAYTQVCVQSNVNGYSAPGEWNSPVTFGNQADMLQNIRQFGFYIYSVPIAQQSQVDRAARKAPLMQVALKEAGAEHKSNIIVNLNA